MGIGPSRLNLVETLLIGIEGKNMSFEDVIEILVSIGSYPKCHSQKTFMIMKMDLAYMPSSINHVLIRSMR